MNLEWKTYAANPLFWYLVRGSKLVGVVLRTDTFNVYIEGETFPAQRTLVAKMPTLDEAKNLLQTLIGVRS
jgi:hypothetical protein